MYDKYINMEDFDTYMTSGYKFERIPKKTLLVRWNASSAPDTKTINLSLREPFKIDVLSDVYLDNFTTFHAAPSGDFNSSEKSAFVLNIDQFNVQSNVAGDITINASGIATDDNMNTIFNNIVIPSDALTNNSNSNVIKSHKSKKMNYVCSINPTTLSKITGKITDLDNNSIFESNDMFLAEFVFVSRK
tara:strand:- start:833 stop:1399 length:567 start_codon:yes stop_codon:yes gene_type:complete